ncbi:MAG: hypothetical protein JKY88_11990 [Pseudomonadales bacterium]|nr:hypothetical protein [Pseudomonadales bacterium]
MKTPCIKEVRLAAAHDGEAELVINIVYPNGAVSEVALDNFACSALFDSCGAKAADDLIGQSWEKVKDALQVSYNRFQK